ncbi:MAG: hypothetical protein CMB73_00415 [Euryarchaeota archaeon]|nr:hypothetical protein [Euryarchaeota archaeon]
MKKIVYTLLLTSIMSSCTFYKYTNQDSCEPDRVNTISNNVSLTAKKDFAVDVRIDLDKIVTGVSQNHADENDARNEAYYNCIVENDIDLVIDPLFKKITNEAPGIFRMFYKNQYRYEIRGYAGYYENPRDAGDETLQNLKDQLAIEQTQLEIDKIAYEKEDALFRVRGKNLNTLAKISPSAKETKSSYMIETVEGCCGENKNNVVVNGNSSGNGFGNVHLLHTAENQSSLVDEYLRLVCEDCDEPAKEESSKKDKKSSSDCSSSSSSGDSGSSLFCKIPLLKNFLCK